MSNYWYVSPSRDGWMNLAMDEWFLDHLSPQDWMLYFYVNSNAVIIGKNQNPWRECDLGTMDRDQVQLVRRISGGGAVYHDRGNLNFSFLTGVERYDVPKQLGLILEAVRSFGIDCQFSGRNDLLAEGRKFSGNAFCGRGELRQHHGTLLLNADLGRLQNYLQVDPRKMKAKGVTSVRSRVCNLTELNPAITRSAMLAAIRRACEAVMGPLTDFPLTDAHRSEIAAYYDKQRSWDWRLGKTPAFDLELDPRFDWGGVQLLLTLKDGRVAQVRVFTDALDPDLPREIEQRLTGVPFGSAPLSAALESDDPRLTDLAQWLREQNL